MTPGSARANRALSFEGLLSSAEKVLDVAGAGACFLLMLIVIVEIFARYVFRVAAPGIYDFAQLLMVAIVFLGLAYTQSQNGHIHVDILVSRLPRWWQNLLQVFTLLLVLGVSIVITYKSGQNAYQAWKIDEVTLGLVAFPLWPGKVMVPIGMGLLSMRFIVQLKQRLTPGAIDK